MNRLLKRILTGVIVIPLVVWSIRRGGRPLETLMAAVSFKSWRELATAISTASGRRAAAKVSFGKPVRSQRVSMVSGAVAAAVVCRAVIPGIIASRTIEGRRALENIAVASWVADAAAYAVGERWGGPKLPAWINANKSLIAYVAGVGAAGISSAVMTRKSMTLGAGVSLGLKLGIASAMGDATESALKRAGELTNSGNVLPGFGGILDRTDSLFAALIAGTKYLLSNSKTTTDV